MLHATWSWDKGSASTSVLHYSPYPDEISKKIEECYVRMGPNHFECDVGGGRVVTKTHKGLVQHVKGEPGRWRAVRRVVHSAGAHVQPFVAAPPPAAAAAAATAVAVASIAIDVNKKKRGGSGASGASSGPVFGQAVLDDDDFAPTESLSAFILKRNRAVFEQTPASSHAPAATSASLQENLDPSHQGRARLDEHAHGRSPLSPAKPPLHNSMPAVVAARSSAAPVDDDMSDEEQDEDPEMKDEQASASEGPLYLVCNDKLWAAISDTASAAGLTRVQLDGEHAVFFTEENKEAITLFDHLGTNLFTKFAADKGTRLLAMGFAQTPNECPHAKVEGGIPTRVYFDSSASQAAYEPAFEGVNKAYQEAGFLEHKPVTVTAMAYGSSHTIHVDPRALHGLTSLQQKKTKEPVQTLLSAERFAELNEIITQASGVTLFGFGAIDRNNLNMRTAQHKKQLGMKGFKQATVFIIRVPGDTLAFSARLAAGGCAALSVEGGVCRFIEARGSELTLIAHAAEPLASCCALPGAVQASLLTAMPDATRDSILLMQRFKGQVPHAKQMVRSLHELLADANLASSVAVPAAPLDRAGTPWQAAAFSAMLKAPTEANVLRCCSGGALKHLGLSLEHVRANQERMRNAQHGDSIKVGMANSAATNPAVQRLMADDPSLTAGGAVVKVGHANSAATNPAAQRLMAEDPSLTASGAVSKAAQDEIKRVLEEEWARRQRQEAALGPAFTAAAVAMHLFR